MEGYRLIDERTLAKLRMTAEEADAVAEMWAVQNRLASPASIAPGLVIPPNEVKQYLSQIRAGSARRFRPARSLGADVRLAAVGALVLIGAAIAFNAMYHSRRNEAGYYRGPLTYDGYAPYAPMPTSTNMRYREERIGNLIRRDYLGYRSAGSSRLPRGVLAELSRDPIRFVIGRGQSAYFVAGEAPQRRIESLRQRLDAVVGGPLTGSSTVPLRPLDAEQIRTALEPPQSDFLLPPNPATLVTWELVEVAFGGKVVKTKVPFALLADAGLRQAVRKEQTRILGALVEAAKDLLTQVSPAQDTPLPEEFPPENERRRRPSSAE